MFQFAKSVLQTLDLHLLVSQLLREFLAHLAVPHRSLDGRPGQVLLFLVDRELRPSHPVGGLLFVFPLLLFQQVLVSQSQRYLGFHLEQLVLHVDNHLFEHLFGIFGLVNQVVQIRPN